MRNIYRVKPFALVRNANLDVLINFFPSIFIVPPSEYLIAFVSKLDINWLMRVSSATMMGNLPKDP